MKIATTILDWLMDMASLGPKDYEMWNDCT